MYSPREIVRRTLRYEIKQFDEAGRTFVAIGLSPTDWHPSVWALMPENVKIQITQRAPDIEPLNSACVFKFLATLD